ncbi:sensor histidine kinase [Sporosarcina saromensis]|uniref:histidine kinase n=2 Tax=Sporosarcina saromensis TaxID=359365 RepID=A0ABU4G7R8_9BACL|nr:sensor histidine kinase [Sporosarcina saromensis]
MLKSKLQRKILSTVISLLSFIILLMSSMFMVLDYNNLIDRSKSVGLQTAKMLSYMDTINEGVLNGNDPVRAAELQATINYYEGQIDATFIVIHSKDGVIMASPQTEKIGKTEPYKDGFKAVVFGANYSMVSNEIIGPSVVSKAPIYDDHKQIIGVVTVGYLFSDLRDIVYQRVINLFYFSLFVLALGVVLSLFLARSIRKDTFGLEPQDIANFYMERKAILASIDEGIIAIDRTGKVTIINTAARRILNVTEDSKGQQINKILPELLNPLSDCHLAQPHMYEMNRNNRKVIVQTMPLKLEGVEKGAVITLRDKTEIMEVVNTLYEVQKYSDDLRAQTHEFTNKLYLLSGLLQLGKYEEAVQAIQSEMDMNDQTSQFILENILDTNVQAILFGKIGKASEMKVDFQIDTNSSLEQLPDFISTGSIAIVLGNLIDNALEEVSEQADGCVTFFTLDIGDDIIIEVSDNGKGISSDVFEHIFSQGYSTKKQANRGFGLANVKRVIDELGGHIQVSLGEGAVFTIYIPKQRNKGAHQDD